MKKIITLLTMPLMLGALAACSDSSEELTQTDDTVTRVDVQRPDVTFYSDGYTREAIFTENLAYIIFHEADKEAVVSALEKKKGASLTETDTLFFNDKADYPFRLRDFEIPAEGLYQYLDCMRAAIRMDYNDLKDIPEVIDAEPYFNFTFPDHYDPYKFMPVSCAIRINSGFGEKLEETAKKANAIVLGKVSLPRAVCWVVARTKDSVGENAFDTMKFFEEAGHQAEPLWHYSGDSGPEAILYGFITNITSY